MFRPQQREYRDLHEAGRERVEGEKGEKQEEEVARRKERVRRRRPIYLINQQSKIDSTSRNISHPQESKYQSKAVITYQPNLLPEAS